MPGNMTMKLEFAAFQGDIQICHFSHGVHLDDTYHYEGRGTCATPPPGRQPSGCRAAAGTDQAGFACVRRGLRRPEQSFRQARGVTASARTTRSSRVGTGVKSENRATTHLSTECPTPAAAG
jgi:hypothetical protein